MSKPKLTPWINGSVKPTRIGVYERGTEGWHSKWDGRFWLRGSIRVETAAHECEPASRHVQRDRWRGLASDPSKGAK